MFCRVVVTGGVETLVVVVVLPCSSQGEAVLHNYVTITIEDNITTIDHNLQLVQLSSLQKALKRGALLLPSGPPLLRRRIERRRRKCERRDSILRVSGLAIHLGLCCDVCRLSCKMLFGQDSP